MYPIASTGLVSFPIHLPSKSTIHVGKYTFRPMDPSWVCCQKPHQKQHCQPVACVAGNSFIWVPNIILNSKKNSRIDKSHIYIYTLYTNLNIYPWWAPNLQMTYVFFAPVTSLFSWQLQPQTSPVSPPVRIDTRDPGRTSHWALHNQDSLEAEHFKPLHISHWYHTNIIQWIYIYMWIFDIYIYICNIYIYK